MESTRRGARSITLARLLVLLAIVSVVAVVLVARYRAYQRFIRDRARVFALLDSLPARRPESVPKRAWEWGCSCVIIAFNNTCDRRDDIRPPWCERFVVDLENRMQAQEPDLDLLDWIWGRIAEIDERSRDYVVQKRPGFDRKLATLFLDDLCSRPPIPDRAFDYLDHCLRTGLLSSTDLSTDPTLAALCVDPRWKERAGASGK